MPIEIYCIENLNWDNGSYKVPNAKPTVFKDRKTVKKIPSIVNYYGGSIPLTGDHGNGAEYNGVYYFLKRERPLDTTDKDPKKHRGLYFLVRDHGTNSVLSNKIVIKGDIATGNLEKDIERNLNRTSLIIENPVGIARVCFDKTENTGRTPLNLVGSRKPIKNTFEEVYLTKHTINVLIKKIESLNRYLLVRPYIYPQRNDLFLFANINPTYVQSHGKTEVANRVNKALEELPDRKDAILGKVSFTSGGYNALKGHYCFTYEKDAIGQRDNSAQINNIDLSNVTDIKRVSWGDLKNITIENLFTLETALLDLETSGQTYSTESKIFKLSQRNFLPLGKDVLQGKGHPPVYLSNGLNNDPGQKITLNKSNDNSLRLYYVDQINFFLSGYKGGKDYTFDGQFQDERVVDHITSTKYHIGKTLTFGIGHFFIEPKMFGNTQLFTPYGYIPPTGEPTGKAHKENNGSDSAYYGLRTRIKDLTDYDSYFKDPRDVSYRKEKVELGSVNVLPHIPFNVTGDKEKYLGNKFKVSPSYGFLIGQINRPRSEWRLFEYLGNNNKDSVQVTTGIKENLLIDEYKEQSNGNKKEGGRRVNSNHPLSKFTGQGEFARLYLDLGQLNFLHFFPDPENSSDYETQQYKCSNDYGFRIRELLLQSQDCELARVLNDQNLKDLDGKKVENPGKEELFNDYSKQIEDKLDKLLIREDLKLPQPLEKGDYLISSLEYRGDNYNYGHGTNRPEYVNWIKPQTGEALTGNLLEDFTNINGTNRDISLEDEIGGKERDKPQIFLGTDLDGSINYFTCGTFEKTHNLSVSPEQYIKEVDGQDYKTIKYYHIKKQKVDLTEIRGPDGLLNLISTFYKTIGKRNFAEGQDNTILGDQLTVHDLNRPEGNLFDLVGSDGFVFIRDENVHFIHKTSTGPDIQPIVTDAQSFIYPAATDKEFSASEGIATLKDLPLIAKINQINTLHYLTYPFSIKTKFLFDGSKYDSRPIATTKTVTSDDGETGFNYEIFKFRSDVDYIDQIIELPKEPVKGRAIADQAAIDKLRIDNQRITLDADLERRQLGLNQTIAEASVRRQDFDLSLEETYKRLNDAMVVAGHATSLAPSILGAIPKVGPALAGVAQAGGNNIARVGIQAALTYGRKDRFGLPKLADATAGGFFGNNATVKNSVGYNSVQPEKARRIEEDKQFKFQEIAFNSYKIDLNHLRRRQDNALAINRLAHEGIKEPVNEAFLNKAWIDDKKVKGFYMTVRYPTGIQLEQLKAYVDEFGIDVDIPDKIITLRAGMAPNIIRLRNIDVEGIVGIENILDREYLAKRLEAGIKIFSMQQAESASSYLESSIYVYDINKDLEKEIKELKEHIEDLENTQTKDIKETTQLTKFLINKLEDPITDPDKLTKDLAELEAKSKEVEANPDKYTPESKKLLNEVKQVLNKRAETARDIDNKQKELAAKKEAAENERDTLREQLNNAHNKERTLMDEKTKLEGELNKVKAAKEIITKAHADAERDLQKGREAAQNCSQGGTPKDKNDIKCGDYCDFLEKYNELNGDYNELYKFLVKDPSFGFSNYDFINGPIPYLQTAKQIVDDCEALLEDNTSLLSYDNNSFREYLLTDEGAKSIRNCKRYFINFGLQHFETIKARGETQRINKHSDYFDKDISISIGARNGGVGTATKKGDTFRTVGRNAQKAQFCTGGNLREMMMFKESFEDASFGGYVRGQEEKTTPLTSYNQTLYYTQANYDLKDTYTLGVPLIYTILLINNGMSNSNELLNKLGNKHNHTTIFNSFRPSTEEGWKHSGTYKGPSSRLMYVGYVLQFIAGVCEHYNDSNRLIELQDFNEMTEYIGPTKEPYMKHFISQYSVEENNYRELTEFRLRVMYKVMCEKKNIDDSFEEANKDMNKAYPKIGPIIDAGIKKLEQIEEYRLGGKLQPGETHPHRKTAVENTETQIIQEQGISKEEIEKRLGAKNKIGIPIKVIEAGYKKLGSKEEVCKLFGDGYNDIQYRNPVAKDAYFDKGFDPATATGSDRKPRPGGKPDKSSISKGREGMTAVYFENPSFLTKKEMYQCATENLQNELGEKGMKKQVGDKVKEFYDTEGPAKKDIGEQGDGTIHADDQERFKQGLSGQLTLKIRSIPKYSEGEIDYDQVLKPMGDNIKRGEPFKDRTFGYNQWNINKKT